MYCICCKQNKIKANNVANREEDKDMSEEDALWRVDRVENPKGDKIVTKTCDNRLWDDGIVEIIHAGYGSKHDGDSIIVAICDDCVSTELENGNILYHSSYMGGYVDDLIENSKKKYRRNSKLDDLVP
jgi:hypothetical protein